MSTHAPGPWAHVGNGDIRDVNGRTVAMTYASPGADVVERAGAVALRIVKCVNAMDGIKDPAEFVAAARAASKFGERGEDDPDDWGDIFRLQAALGTREKA